MNDSKRENQSVTPAPLVRDEGVGGSNPLTPTIDKLKKLFTPAQPTAQARWSYERDEVYKRRQRGGAGILVDYYILRCAGRGSENPVAFVFDAADADRIVSCLNAMEARQ
ncbi:MAG: hypothetical protein INH13_25850 [Cupriavidus sp.]|nr:hypothetical protein [Cupriavidus sp.]